MHRRVAAGYMAAALAVGCLALVTFNAQTPRAVEDLQTVSYTDEPKAQGRAVQRKCVNPGSSSTLVFHTLICVMQLAYNKQAGLWQVYDLPGVDGGAGQGPFLVDLPLSQVDFFA
jgi:hypothetical protein